MKWQLLTTTMWARQRNDFPLETLIVVVVVVVVVVFVVVVILLRLDCVSRPAALCNGPPHGDLSSFDS